MIAILGIFFSFSYSVGGQKHKQRPGLPELLPAEQRRRCRHACAQAGQSVSVQGHREEVHGHG